MVLPVIFLLHSGGGVIFFEGYLVIISGLGTFYVYNTADNSLVSGIDLDLPNVTIMDLGGMEIPSMYPLDGSDTVEAFTLTLYWCNCCRT